ncbi:hypothetical protein CDIK_2801 [Cucumispora dikerogammari]|nr:hypothetical protein CDIK_2801 [Cucumispora dikerogammari]
MHFFMNNVARILSFQSETQSRGNPAITTENNHSFKLVHIRKKEYADLRYNNVDLRYNNVVMNLHLDFKFHINREYDFELMETKTELYFCQQHSTTVSMESKNVIEPIREKINLNELDRWFEIKEYTQQHKTRETNNVVYQFIIKDKNPGMNSNLERHNKMEVFSRVMKIDQKNDNFFLQFVGELNVKGKDDKNIRVFKMQSSSFIFLPVDYRSKNYYKLVEKI